ncbi:WXG100 family type VII secretion target [Streptomyces pseudogriseolus]|uniref:WXG100 family type VII secretion target n=1 Tax=Streptomyces pseudogriseolus TaxID=36817 RepID=UPI003FA3105F
MGEQAGRRTPQAGRTNFESMTHEQLVALLDSASPEGAAQLATKLSKASSTITKIGDDLMTYVKGLEWQGEGGDAFRDWGGQSAAATLRLGQYAEVASRWLSTVAQAVAEAKAAIPATSETTQAKADLAEARKTLAATQDPGARNDPDARKLAQMAQSDAAAAQQRMEAARAEAIQQLRKLAQTYEYSAYQVNSVEPPTFSPPAQHLEASEWRRPDQQHVVGSGASAAHVSTGGPYTNEGRTEATAATPPASYVTASGDTSDSTREPVRPRPVAMEIDGVTTLPETRSPTPVSTTPTPPGPGPRPDAGPVPQPLGAPPTPLGRGGAPGPFGAQQLAPTARPPLLPGQAAMGGGRLPGPGESGIVGGRPVQPGAGKPATGLPRGTVIGADAGHGRTSQGHSPLGRAVSTGVPSIGGVAGGSAGAGGGRRLASEAGGVIGNRPVQPGRSGPRPFTPGGVGLVRQAHAGESAHGPTAGRAGGVALPAAQSASRRDRGQDGGQRPDYLAEEEETWARSDRRTVPPVVD